MIYKDLLEFMKTVEEHGEIQCIPGKVDWNLEMSASARKCDETGAPDPTLLQTRLKVIPSPAG